MTIPFFKPYQLQLMRLCVFITAISVPNAAFPDSKNVDVKANTAQWIDGVAAVNQDCHSLVTSPEIKSQAQNGKIEIRFVPSEIPEGPCKGKTIKYLGVGYAPNRGFKGTDNATITYRAPRGSYYIGQELRVQTRTYIITVK